MLTVADALALDEMNGARVVAGKTGLDRAIAWVHNPGVVDAAQWLNGGELILTTYNNVPHTAQEQCDYLLALIEKGVAGLVLAVGQIIDHMPDTMIEIANAHDFPLIEISYRVRFVDVARAINERIAQTNLAMVTRALTIHKTLTQLVLEGGDLKKLANTLADLTNQSVSIETARFEALASHNIGAIDEARRYTLEYGRTDPRLVAALEDQVLPEIRRTLRPVFIPAMPHVGLGMERILAPVVMQGEIYGYVWLIADDRPLSDLDHLAIESGATIAALMMLHQRSIQDAEASLKGNLLTRLVQGEMTGANVLTDQALRYGVALSQPYYVLLVEYPQATSQRLLRLYREVNQAITQNRHPAIIGQYAGQIMLLAQTDATPETMIAVVRAQTSGEDQARIAVSATHNGTHAVHQAYSECREVLEITRKLGEYGPDVYFNNLGYLHTLYHAGPRALEGNPYMPALRELMGEQQADLFHTLETYLDAGANGVSTAERLHIHRSTLNYRLQRIAEICDVDLSHPVQRMNLQVALKLLRLFEVDT